jgi:uncharacterized protein (TIGR02646 family)
MIRVERLPLPQPALHSLQELQSGVSGLASYAERIAVARERFHMINRRGNPTFDVIKSTLAAMCAGACRCMYCEDSAANEVEHFRPKTFYPDLVFVWLNYLYSCGACNRAKRSRFRLLLVDEMFLDLVRDRMTDPTEPAQGAPVLLDPLSDDPLQFLSLDLRTFHFVPTYGARKIELARAEYTIEQLQLNRDLLPEARREAFQNYCARLFEYGQTTDHADRAAMASAIGRAGHPTVWMEMKRQSHLYADIARLFDAAPEARGW